MIVLESLEKLPKALPYPVMAIGVFDGVHRGHSKILEGLTRRAREKEGAALLLTFFPHPQKIISPADAPLLLQTADQKVEMLSRTGIDWVIQVPFTRELSLFSPQDFAARVLAQFGVKEVFVGSNFRFGHRRSGDFETLNQLGKQYGFRVRATPDVCFRGSRISSTRIRQALKSGRMSLARGYLGRPYRISGTVVRGAGKGNEMGFPTANLDPENELIPAGGVYCCRVFVNGQAVPAVTNVGFRPTLYRQTSTCPVVETHLLDSPGDLYGKRMEIEFCFRLRAERKFDKVSDLVDQIQKDVSRVQRLLRG